MNYYVILYPNIINTNLMF